MGVIVGSRPVEDGCHCAEVGRRLGATAGGWRAAAGRAPRGGGGH